MRMTAVRHRPSTAESGFSLVELLVAMLVSTLVATGIVMNLDFKKAAAASDPAETLGRLTEELRRDAVTQGRILALRAEDGALHRLVWQQGDWTADARTAPLPLEGLRNPARGREDLPALVASPTGLLEGQGFVLDTPDGLARLVLAPATNRLERAR